ncbi:cation efflux protein [Ramaria rubella]|nr:cation efflux protein [Ramaria rubella]
MFSRSTKIKVLLVVDVIFFFIEIFAGYAVGSLALVADSFHMLNDVLSLIVALYAIKLTTSRADQQYSYGWHRAEIVAALVNGVFLVALCLSIFLEAIERFFNTSEVKNPKLVVIVGSWGLLSNFLGLILFHEHVHSSGEAHKPKPTILSRNKKRSIGGASSPETENVIGHVSGDESHRQATMCGHPVATRASLMQAAQNIGYGAVSSARSLSRPGRKDDLIDIDDGQDSKNYQQYTRAKRSNQEARDVHASQDHAHSHRNGSMNMHALILHVIGDALGNVGVITTGLVIWLSTWQYKHYFDPMISLVITCIIFSSALPLVRSASFILLQAVPSTISLKDIREDIQEVDGVLSVHELHIWQLSETKIVASVHVRVSPRREYMHVTQDVRRILHEHGVHSCTVQPELIIAQGALVGGKLITEQDERCLVPCPPDQSCDVDHACCPPHKQLSPPLIDV